MFVVECYRTCAAQCYWPRSPALQAKVVMLVCATIALVVSCVSCNNGLNTNGNVLWSSF
jgi:hypothetical protein